MHKDTMVSQNEPAPSAQLDLANEIHELTKYIKQVNTVRKRFVLGVAAGVGTVLGATIVAAPLLILLSKLLFVLGWTDNILSEEIDRALVQ